MKRLIYTFERVHPAHGSSFRPIVEDVILDITMAGLGLGDVQRRVDGATDPVQAPDLNMCVRFWPEADVKHAEPA